jgi:hypothetical protein
VFTFVEWDNPVVLVAELALSVAFIAGIMFAARLVNAKSPSPPGGGSAIPGNPPDTED